MKTIYKQFSMLALVALLCTSKLSGQCLGGWDYGYGNLNGIQSQYQQISWCMFFSERNYLNVSFISGFYTFSVTNASYITIYDINNNVVAQGNSPLANVQFSATGTYYLKPTSSGPPTCGGGSGCIDSFWKCELPCSGTPSAGTLVATPTLVCPGSSATLSLPGSTQASGLQYQWYMSTFSSLGTWTAVNTATDVTYMTNTTNTASTWYYATITCSNSALTVTSGVVQVDIAGTTISTAPYKEDFEGLSYNDQLPNCSWTADNFPWETNTWISAGSDNRQPHSGDKYATFYYWPGGTNAFYTNGIQLYANVTYSASVWYISNMWGYDNWEDLSIAVGPSQTSIGQVTVASINSPAVNSSYRALGGTFTVPANGIYYVSVAATSNQNSWGTYLTWDDLSIDIPCDLNQPNMTVSTPNGNTICKNDNVIISANGVDTYSWSNGATTNSIAVSPPTNTVYTVWGTSTLTGCQVMQQQQVTVNDLPFVYVVADKQKVCEGGQVNLTAVGNAVSYQWSGSGGSGSYITVSPQSVGVTNYQVQGTSAEGCQALASINITVNANPVITASGSKTMVCAGESLTLTAVGIAGNGVYTWHSNQVSVQSNPAVVYPTGSTVYHATGVDANGCVGTSNQLPIAFELCLGVNESGKVHGLSVFPNPSAGVFNISMENSSDLTVEVADLVGRSVYSGNSTTVDLSNLANGVYYLKVTSAGSSDVVRIIKD